MGKVAVVVSPRAADISNNKKLNKLRTTPNGTVDREYIRRLLTPKNKPKYFIDRKYSESVLDDHCVFLCDDATKSLFNRCVVPVFYNDKVIGYTGRSIFEECKDCGCYHSDKDNCPSTVEERKRLCKWKNINLDRSYALYHNNLNGLAGKPIVLVEGQGDVWKLAELGFNGVGLFGNSISDWQCATIAKLSPPIVIVCFDNDNGGEIGIPKIINKLKRYTNITVLQPDGKDVSESKGEWFENLRLITNPYG